MRILLIILIIYRCVLGIEIYYFKYRYLLSTVNRIIVSDFLPTHLKILKKAWVSLYNIMSSTFFRNIIYLPMKNRIAIHFRLIKSRTQAGFFSIQESQILLAIFQFLSPQPLLHFILFYSSIPITSIQMLNFNNLCKYTFLFSI